MSGSSNAPKVVPSYLQYVDELPASTPDKYQIIKSLAEGGHGHIYEACLSGNEDGPRFVLKKKLRRKKSGISTHELQEVHALRILENEENIVKLVDIIRVPNDLILVLNLAKTDLYKVTRNSNLEISEQETRIILKQFFQGLSAIHSHGLIHRDIKPANVLISCDGIIQIADFGISSPLAEMTDDKRLSPHTGTTAYKSIEMLLGDEQYDQKVDMWAAGCMAFEIWGREILFLGDNKTRQIREIAKMCGYPNTLDWPRATTLKWHQHFHCIFGSYQQDRIFDFALEITKNQLSADFLTKLIRLYPEHRLTAHEALQHNFFTSSPVGPSLKSLLERIQ